MKRLSLLFFVCIVSLCVRPADAQPAYFDGSYQSSGTNCPVTGTGVTVMQAKTGYFTDLSSYPKTGDIAYVRAFGANISPCVNDAFGPEFFLPDGASLAISATNRVYCILGKVDGTVADDVSAQRCTQAPQSPTNYGGYFFGWSALPPGWFFEVRVPVMFNKKLSGLGGPASHRLTVAAASAYPPYNLYPYQPVTVFYQAAFENLISSGVTSSSASLAFDLKSYFHDGLLYVDYGTTNPPPSSPSSTNVPNTALSFPVTASLTGLIGSTTYYWRARFLTSDGTFTSATQSFTTSGAGTQLLTVLTSGTGMVTSSPGGITCGATCSASFASGSGVTLTPTPGTGWRFGVWGGDCSGTGSCVVTMSSAKSVTAAFTREIGSLSLTLGGLPSGESVTLGITGPDGFNTTQTMTTGTGLNYSDVATGTYTVTAPVKNVGGTTYAPTAASQSAAVNFGQTTTINVTYGPQAAETPGDFDGDGRADLTVYRPATGTWYIKDQAPVVYGAASDLPVPGDYNGDATTDVAVFRPSNGTWYLRGIGTVAFGVSSDIPVPADYDGDGQTDIAVFRPGTGTWYVRNQITVQWGAADDIPVAANYTGDSRAEIAVYRPSDGTWYVSGQLPVQWGTSSDIPVPADYNGDGVVEIAVYRPTTGTWYIRGMGAYPWGAVGDMPVPQDLNGDGRAELVVYRPDTGYWYSYNTGTDATTADQHGAEGDLLALWRPGLTWLQRGDFEGDRRADPTVFRPSTGAWFSLQSSSGLATSTSTSWGASGDVPVPGDYRGLGRNQAAVFRPSTGMWYVQGGVSVAFGVSSDQVVPGDYDGDGRTDVAVFRPSTGAWYVLSSSSGFTTGTSQTWGASGDVPVPGDYDGDRRTDLAVFRPSTGVWFVLLSSSGNTTSFTRTFGTTGDLPVVGDYDGDRRTDIAVFRPSTGTWYLLYSSTDFTIGSSTVFGASGDTPVAADYDGDGRTDIAIYRGSTSTWFVLGQFSVAYGTSGDIPVLKQP